MIIKSHAKINLSFTSTGLSPSGYHNVAGVTLPIDLHDEIEINHSIYDDCSTQIDIGLSDFHDNLAFKAVELFRKKINVDSKFVIKIVKNIPIMAGFGGASSNAVAVLKYLNGQFKNNLFRDEMSNLCSQIGSDCAFFLQNTPAKIKGLGHSVEKVSDLFCENISKYCFVVFKPEASQNTTLAYKNLKENFSNLYLTELECKKKINNLVRSVENYEDVLPIFNIFDEIMCKNNKKHYELKHIFREIGVQMLLTGSGTGCFCVFKNHNEVKLVKDMLISFFGKKLWYKEAKLINFLN